MRHSHLAAVLPELRGTYPTMCYCPLSFLLVIGQEHIIFLGPILDFGHRIVRGSIQGYNYV